MRQHYQQAPEQHIAQLNQQIQLIQDAITVIHANQRNPVKLPIKNPCHIMENHHKYKVPCVSPDRECLGCCLYNAHLTLQTEQP